MNLFSTIMILVLHIFVPKGKCAFLYIWIKNVTCRHNRHRPTSCEDKYEQDIRLVLLLLAKPPRSGMGWLSYAYVKLLLQQGWHYQMSFGEKFPLVFSKSRYFNGVSKPNFNQQVDQGIVVQTTFPSGDDCPSQSAKIISTQTTSAKIIILSKNCNIS